jgi:hypothetical protein
MGRAQQKQAEQNIKACGCLVIGLIILVSGGCNALLSDDEKKKPKPAASSTPTPHPDRVA